MITRAMRRCCFVAPLFALVLLAPTHWARAQVESREGIALQNEILQLRHEVESLRGQLAAGGGAANPYPAAPPEGSGQIAGNLTARLLTRVATLEDQVRTLTGRIDELANQVKRQGDVLTKQIGDLNFRLQTLEGGSHGAPAAHRSEPPNRERQAEAAPVAPPEPRSPPPGALGALPLVRPPQSAAPNYPAETAGGALPLLPPPQPQEPPAGPEAAMAGGALPLLPPSASPATPAQPAAPPRTTEARLREVRAALGRREYASAEAGARAVLGAASKRHAAEAHYLLARALSGQRNYAKAAVAYDEAYKSSPTGPYAEVALLGMASSLADLGAKPAACAALDKLKAEFLTKRAAVREGAANLRKREGCHP